MKNKIMDFLQMTSEEYDLKMWLTYLNWCDKYATSESHFQQLLANSAINAWYMIEFEKLQNRFIQMMAHIPQKTDAIRYHYNGCIIEIFTIFPKPLIDESKCADSIKTKLIKNTPLFYAN